MELFQEASLSTFKHIAVALPVVFAAQFAISTFNEIYGGYISKRILDGQLQHEADETVFSPDIPLKTFEEEAAADGNSQSAPSGSDDSPPKIEM